MEQLSNYILKPGLCLLVLYLFYYTLLRSQPGLKQNRAFLLLAPLVAVLLPFLPWPSLFPSESFVAHQLQSIQLPEVVVSYSPAASEAGSVGSSLLSIKNMLLFTYLLGLAILASRLVLQLFNIRKLIAASKPVANLTSSATVLKTENGTPTFAFLDYVFLGDQAHLSEREKKQVLTHELAHVQLHHTWDILYYELLTSVMWFNPIIWLLKSELRDVHEYQADAYVVSEHQPAQYTSLLAKEALYKTGVPMGSYFREPQVFKRLQMLQQRDKKTGWLRPLLILPLLFIMATVFSAQHATADIANSLTATANNQTTQEPTAPALITDTDALEPPAAPGSAIAGTAPKMPPPTDITEDVVFQKPKTNETPEAEEKAEPYVKPYSYVENMPQFKGGDAELLKYLGKNMRYPKQAQEAGIEGMVVVNFTVNTDGTLSDIKMIRSLGGGTDEEAIRVVESMSGQWQPGTQNGRKVPVSFNLPIRFTIK
ncbi:M56 family metallopeptidase [Pontibacter harenae]|uniref:M56 family metallopeptidase n=1 Tax=Pontibacter harenae TaxID=2894083 RepID=UPI001E41B0BB|nr:M56 family metallopeptidase [Pontibacter harenae]MCC9166189.1 TonB family protein [Pontibacter harenae]